MENSNKDTERGNTCVSTRYNSKVMPVEIIECIGSIRMFFWDHMHMSLLKIWVLLSLYRYWLQFFAIIMMILMECFFSEIVYGNLLYIKAPENMITMIIKYSICLITGDSRCIMWSLWTIEMENSNIHFFKL
jgi:hypothetical protein